MKSLDEACGYSNFVDEIGLLVSKFCSYGLYLAVFAVWNASVLVGMVVCRASSLLS